LFKRILIRRCRQRQSATRNAKPNLRPWLVLLVLSLAAACHSDREPLNSERIEHQFGSYGVEVLHADAATRISSLYSSDGPANRTTRTYAVVEFALPVDQRILAEHERVIAGASLGQVFVNAGWHIEKQTLSITDTSPAAYSDNVVELMRIEARQALATHRYRFFVSKDRLRIPYATITEVHHPDYLEADQLRSMYE
jgi:hypothetical protein